MSSNLFEEFTGVSEAAFKQKIQYDLKGADYQETLLTATREGINIKPFYHSDSAPQINIPARSTAHWYISQKIYAGNAVAANKKARNILERGSEGVIFVIPNNTVNPSQLFLDLPEHAGLQVHTIFLDVDYLKAIHKIRPQAYVHIDIIYQLVYDGNWFENGKKDHENYGNFLALSPGFFSNITVNTATYQQAGATVTQELAYYAAHLNEYLNHYLSGDKQYENMYSAFAKAAPPQPTAPYKRINVDTAIGANYFMEIAKYRAYRIITKALGDIYEIDLTCYITAVPSARNKSLLDYNVNMLRTTTECMSAILGGADTICNLPYDAFFNKENEFSDRIARNQLRILKDEAYLDKISNPAAGSYYIDTLTQQLTDKALDLFKTIEKAGGFVQSIFNGTIQRKIKESATQEQQAFINGSEVKVGVNKYPNSSQPLQKEYAILPFQKINPRKTLVQPIVPKRLAEELEKQKLTTL